MNYHAYEFAHAALGPLRLSAKIMKNHLNMPYNLYGDSEVGKQIKAACEVFEGVTRRYGKPEWGIENVTIEGESFPINEKIVLSKTFCELLHFERKGYASPADEPKVLIVAPMSGHYATLLRGTVEAMLPDSDVYITDWNDARDIPLYMGRFDLDDFIDYLIEFMQFLGPDLHVIAVCQPTVPALVATSVMATLEDPNQPTSLTLMGGPIDCRRNPTQVNQLAETKPIEWFERNVINYVPFPNPGCMRQVYPGFIQLSGFMTMNLDRHITAHKDLFDHLVEGDEDSAQKHKDFYEEYLSVMDLTAEFYIQTVKVVFQEYALAKGTMMHRDIPVDCGSIVKTALMTVEGEKDDVCGLGQTEAAQGLCYNIPENRKLHYVQPSVGHYGVFNGNRFRNEIRPRVMDFIRMAQTDDKSDKPKKKSEKKKKSSKV